VIYLTGSRPISGYGRGVGILFGEVGGLSMGSGERAEDGKDSGPDSDGSWFRRRFILDPRQCVFIEVADRNVRRAVHLGGQGVESAMAVAEGTVDLGRKVVGHEAQRPEA